RDRHDPLQFQRTGGYNSRLHSAELWADIRPAADGVVHMWEPVNQIQASDRGDNARRKSVKHAEFQDHAVKVI
uniref:hypothetical protein n=1 Tax=Escherichia coli TaxID=562 RepID=UPI001BC82C08